MTRRAVLVGGASAIALAACSKSSDSGSPETTPAPTASLLALFPVNDYITAQVPQRVAFAIANPEGGLSKKGPDPLEFTITAAGGVRIVTKVPAHGEGLPYVYYPVSFTAPKAGQYTISATVDGDKISSALSIGAKGSSDVPGPLDKLPSMKTPTTADAAGVDPICTQDPPCPLHTVSLDEALTQDKPVVYLVATPKFCQTGICGPVLDVLETVAKDYTDKVTFIHQEVYESAKQAAENGTGATLAAQVQKLKITSEPVLFVTGRDGVIHYRLDSAYDQTELRNALDDVLG